MSPDRERWVRTIAPEGEETLGVLVRRERLARGWSQEEVAARLAPDDRNMQSTLSKIERDKVGRPDPEFLERLAALFALPVERLVVASYRTSRQPPLPRNAVAIGPLEPGLVEVLEALRDVDSAKLPLAAQHLRLLAEGPPPRERAEDEPAG